jgi:hypothetical protein
MRPQDYELPGGYSVELLEESSFGRDDAIRFWVSEEVLDAEEAERRAGEILYVGIHEGDGLVGISTAYLDVPPRLGVPMWHQRGFVSEGHRESNLGMFFAIWGIAHLEEQFEQGIDRRGLGVVQVIENPGLMRYFNRGWEPPTDMVFIGENEQGHHVRIHPFPSATLPEAPPA